MIGMVELTVRNDSWQDDTLKVWVNPEHVVAVRPGRTLSTYGGRGTHGANIVTVAGQADRPVTFDVTEAVDEVMAKFTKLYTGGGS